ncbi:unnamed protein product [Oncorhynchus mykiss]|uniref:SGTA homodimerisation domain-containing protein n=1 Tax=Oncorhynchus mykiss TaxID=8022 RepID=A0A060W0Z6_ONCMY|nr:unnamed protein product [Oncorhynchus mykiss]
MAVEKRLAFSIVQFLRDQTHCGALNSDEQESLEVAIQCLETTFKINSSDCHLAAPQPLTEIFLNSLLKNDQNNPVPPETSPSPEDTERAEQLKNEGNNHMKEENYSCAVECYSKAINLDLRNAVYYCNRAAAHSRLGNYTEATGDCERAIGIDPSYSKAYGRMGLAFTAMNKYPEAISYFKKALVLDPENDTYKSNLKIAEQKQKEAVSPVSSAVLPPFVISYLKVNLKKTHVIIYHYSPKNTVTTAPIMDTLFTCEHNSRFLHVILNVYLISHGHSSMSRYPNCVNSFIRHI